MNEPLWYGTFVSAAGPSCHVWQSNVWKIFQRICRVESFQGRLRLRLPRQLFDGKQKYPTLGLPDTQVNRKVAEAKAKLIEADMTLERFNYTLAKYGKLTLPQ